MAAQSESWARRLLRELTNPRELLQRRRYRTAVFLGLFLDHVEEQVFRDPRAGLRLARFAPKLALLVPEAPGAEGRRHHREALLRAHCMLAGAYRAAGLHAAAESEYELAQWVADSEAISPIARADLSARLAVFWARKDRFAEALALVAAAAAAYRAAGDRRRLAEAYGVRGYVLAEGRHLAQAVPWHGKALKLALSVKRTARDPADVAALARVIESARANMAHDVMQSSSSMATAGTALEYIRACHRELRGRRNSLTRHLLQWTEGKLLLRLSLDHRGERRLQTARRGFVRLQVPWEIALVSLDLAAVYRARRQWADLETLAADTFRRFRELCGDFEAIAALSLWVDAVEARDGAAAAIEAAREVLEARSRR
ncbi:MAG: hypothetical protein GY719_17570 [bacterium]|nr:hypothetical protein [bacterium]